MVKCVFLDRDGTLCKDYGYNNNPGKIELLPGVGEGLRKLKEKGFLLVVISNQSCVARGICKLKDVINFNNALNTMLKKEYGVLIDKFYFCPHHPYGIVEEFRKECICRKPNPGMILKAREELNIDLSKSYLIGDKERDIEAGKKAGVFRSFLFSEKNSFLEIVKKILEA